MWCIIVTRHISHSLGKKTAVLLPGKYVYTYSTAACKRIATKSISTQVYMSKNVSAFIFYTAPKLSQQNKIFARVLDFGFFII